MTRYPVGLPALVMVTIVAGCTEIAPDTTSSMDGTWLLYYDTDQQVATLTIENDTVVAMGDLNGEELVFDGQQRNVEGTSYEATATLSEDASTFAMQLTIDYVSSGTTGSLAFTGTFAGSDKITGTAVTGIVGETQQSQAFILVREGSADAAVLPVQHLVLKDEGVLSSSVPAVTGDCDTPTAGLQVPFTISLPGHVQALVCSLNDDGRHLEVIIQDRDGHIVATSGLGDYLEYNLVPASFDAAQTGQFTMNIVECGSESPGTYSWNVTVTTVGQ